MLKKIINILVGNVAKKNNDKTMIYVSQASLYLILSLVVLALAGFLSSIPVKDSLVATQVTVTFALVLGGIQIFVRFLDIVFEAIRHDFDNRNKA